MLKVRSSTEDFVLIDEDLGRVPPGAEAIHRKCGIYTRPEVVEEILDGVGWTAAHDLVDSKLLEPAVGDGAFLTIAARRLIVSMRNFGHPLTTHSLADRIRAFEIHPREANRARENLALVLAELRVPTRLSRVLVNRWVTVGDFLITPISDCTYSHIVGNPPYSRWSKIPISLRRRYEKILPRRMSKGDVFLPFLDLSIGYLARDGRLGFVCSDRWKFMAFAEAFRQERMPEIVIERETRLDASDAYVKDVDVYPSILILRRRRHRFTSIVRRSPATIIESGYSVRVGPALGCRPAYVLAPEEGGVESELLTPLIDAADIQNDEIRWGGNSVIVLYDNNGSLRRLRDYPLAESRLGRYRAKLKDRAIVKAGAVWYRPIDRVIAAHWARPKLLIPELAKVPRVAIDRSGAIPSHGVYAIFSNDDDVEKLFASLRDGGLARALDGVAPKIKGGYVRCYRRFLEMITV